MEWKNDSTQNMVGTDMPLIGEERSLWTVSNTNCRYLARFRSAKASYVSWKSVMKILFNLQVFLNIQMSCQTCTKDLSLMLCANLPETIVPTGEEHWFLQSILAPERCSWETLISSRHSGAWALIHSWRWQIQSNGQLMSEKTRSWNISYLRKVFRAPQKTANFAKPERKH